MSDIKKTWQEIMTGTSESDACMDVALRFTDPLGVTHQFTIPAKSFTEELIKNGQTFDGSSIRMWRDIHESDMVMMPDPDSMFIDPFASRKTAVVYCSVKDPYESEGYNRDPRSIADKAEKYLVESGVGEKAFFGPEGEFFLFDSVKYQVDDFSASHEITSREMWNDKHNSHKVGVKGGYAPVAPQDTVGDIRGEMVSNLEKVGIEVETQHHEVASAGQCEIDIKYDTLKKMADKTMTYRYVVKNTAVDNLKTATFMPKPIFGDNGSGMHVHASIWKTADQDDIEVAKIPTIDGLYNRFAPIEKQYEVYGGVSQTAMHALGGILIHAPALTAFANPSTNSFKRLVPGFEAPINITYAARNRSAIIRIPFVGDNPSAKRFEFRSPDNMANPYILFSAILMAMIDGIENKYDPGSPSEQDLFATKHDIPQIPTSLEGAMSALKDDMGFLLKGGVFTKDFINAWIDKKIEESKALGRRPHPYEFEMYYNA
jgi:glutamine synthetase